MCFGRASNGSSVEIAPASPWRGDRPSPHDIQSKILAKHPCKARSLQARSLQSKIPAKQDLKAASTMQAPDAAVTFLLVVAIGGIAGVLFDRLAGPSWLARRFAGSSRDIITSALVGVAGALVGYHIVTLLVRGGMVTSLIAAAVGAAVLLFGWRMAK
jgi:uncharacterized membrane protein YeaQ/YmgE (transglycosylase-associated protein family)